MKRNYSYNVFNYQITSGLIRINSESIIVIKVYFNQQEKMEQLTKILTRLQLCTANDRSRYIYVFKQVSQIQVNFIKTICKRRYMMNIGKRISELRNKKGISQLQLAKDLNVSRNTVSMWETNKRAIKNERIIQLADYFNVTTDYLLGRVEFDNNDLIAAFNEVVAKFTK